MSWEPTNPIGFSPCGTAFGAVRHCYRAPCRFFADGGQTNQITWYRVPDNRPFYTGVTCFTPMVDEMFRAEGGEYELTGVNPNPRKHYSGRDVWFRLGDHVHGDDADFLGESPSDKYVSHGRGPYDPCAEPEHVFAEIGLGGFRDNLLSLQKRKAGLNLGSVGHDHWGTNDESLAGLELGGFIPYPIQLRSAGLALGGRPDDLTPAVEKKKAGLALGDVRDNGVEVGELAGVGLALGAITTETVFPVGHSGGGMLLGGVGADVAMETESIGSGLALGVRGYEPSIGETHLAGIALGDVGSNVFVGTAEEKRAGLEFGVSVSPATTTAEGTDAGLELGGDGGDVDHDDEGMGPGLLLGGIVSNAAPPPFTPGTSCGGAGLLTLGSAGVGTIASFAMPQWATFPTVAGQQYTVAISLTSGSGISVDLSDGTCASNTLKHTYSTFPTSFSWTPSSSANGILTIHSSFGGSVTYSILVTSP